MVCIFFFSINSFAQSPTYKLVITNESQPDAYTYEFEVFLLNTSTDTLELMDVQFGIGYDTTILNGGTATNSFVSFVNGDSLLPAPSELLPAQVPNLLPTGTAVNTIPAYPGTKYFFFNCAPRTPPGIGNGTIISSTSTGCDHPGTRISRFRITNSVPFRANSTCRHIWSSSQGPQRTNTILMVYDHIGANFALNITNHFDNINYDYSGTCLTPPTGLILNPTGSSVPENSADNNALIFPQPVTGEVTIRLKQRTKGNHIFNVYDLQGKLVMNHSFYGDQFSFNTGHLSGLYFIDFPDENIHAKMIVQ